MPQELEKSIIRILNQNGETTGTGFLVGDRLAVTCAHVVEFAGAHPGSLCNVQLHIDPQHQRILAHESLAAALDAARLALTHRGFTAFDVRNANQRDQAVALSLDISLDLLTNDERERFLELAVFRRTWTSPSLPSKCSRRTPLGWKPSMSESSAASFTNTRFSCIFTCPAARSACTM